MYEAITLHPHFPFFLASDGLPTPLFQIFQTTVPSSHLSALPILPFLLATSSQYPIHAESVLNPSVAADCPHLPHQQPFVLSSSFHPLRGGTQMPSQNISSIYNCLIECCTPSTPRVHELCCIS